MNKELISSCTFTIDNFVQVKQKLLNWVKRFNTFCFLDNHLYQIAPHTVECLLAAGVRRQLKMNAGNALEHLQQFIDDDKGWLFGHLGYDLKNEIENLSSSHPDKVDFPDLFFFEPEIIIHLTEFEIVIEAENPEVVFAEIIETSPDNLSPLTKNIAIKNRISRDEYVAIINKLKDHIRRGDCYEINFCQEFYANDVIIDPLQVYQKLCSISPNPFSALYRVNNNWLICASPERFLKKTGYKILSQPIKGTSKRHLKNKEEDNYNKVQLTKSAKDLSENVMVVDLVRNDLAKICAEGTVQVDELYGIYSFPQVHQLISTVSGTLKENICFSEIIKATFPMGSMTGAPKNRVMELIEQYEKTRRGIFSGCLGYISPKGGLPTGQEGFDFNVVIRSIMYNTDNNYLSYQAGSGITFKSNAEMEWEECLLKAAAIKQVLENNED